MFLRCKHQWQEMERVTVSGADTMEGFRGDIDDYLAIRAGQTLIELKCERCGDVKGVTLQGQFLADAVAPDA